MSFLGMVVAMMSLVGPPDGAINITATIPAYLEARVLAQDGGETTLLVRANVPWVVDAPRAGTKPAHWAGESVVLVAGNAPTVSMAEESVWRAW